MSHSEFKLVKLGFMAVLLSSCAMFAPDDRGTPLLETPLQFSNADKIGEQVEVNNKWWEEINSAELNSLIDKAISQNLNLKQVYAKLMQAQATAVQGGADLLPSLNATGKGDTTHTHVDGSSSTDVDSYNLGATVSYELDLWGRVRSSAKKADYTYQASAEDVNAAKTTLAAEVATKWLNIISYNKRVETKKEQIKTNRVHLELMELRYKKGQATALDVYQQRQAVAQTVSGLPKLEAQLASNENALALLLGEMPAQGKEYVQTTDLPSIVNVPNAGVPADLLESRPDIRKAMVQLKSSEWQLSASKADMLPKISLSASYTFSGAELNNSLFENWISNLAANLTAPLFQGGYKKAEVEKTKALVDERVNAYMEKVLIAIREVEDALINEKKQTDYIAAVQENHDASKASYKEALARYRKGINDYLPVLSALTSLQTLEDELITARQDALVYRINLYKALGRGWEDK